MFILKPGMIDRHNAGVLKIYILTLVILFSVLLAPASSLADETSSASAIACPGKLLTEPLSANQVKLTWVDKSENEQGFQIERSTDRAFLQNQVKFVAATNETNYVDHTAEPLTIYYYRVKAFTADAESTWSNLAIVQTPDIVPVPPSGLFVSSPASYQVQLLWTDNSNNESGFKVVRATNSSFTEGLTGFVAGANVTKCLDFLTPGGNYFYRIAAFNAAGESNPSESKSISVDSKLFEDSFLIGPVTEVVTTHGFAQYSLPFSVNASGLVQNSDIVLTLSDQSGKVTFTKGTKMLNFNNHALTNISYDLAGIAPQPPADREVLRSLIIGPVKATFDPAITMVLKYDLASLQPGVDVNNIRVGSWDGNNWDLLNPISVNNTTGEVTVKVNHSALLSVMAAKAPIPSPYSVSDLTVIPGYIIEGEKALLQVNTKNSGATPGNYELILMLNDELEESRVVALEAGASYTETFQLVNKEIDSYKININGLKNKLVVQPKPTVTSSNIITPTEDNPLTTTATQTSKTLEIPESNYTPRKPNMTLIMAIAGAMGFIIVVSLMIFFIKK
jgi:hypothetical protein